MKNRTQGCNGGQISRPRYIVVLLLMLPLSINAQHLSDVSDSTIQPATAATLLADAPSTVLREIIDPFQTYTPSDLTPARMKVANREAKVANEIARNTACENGKPYTEKCGVSWSRILGESFIFLSAQHGGNIWMDRDTRDALTHGSFWGDYVYCVEHYRWNRWKDDDPFGVDYIGHPMMGAVTNAMYEQNDPKQRALTYENTHRYWMGRLRATAYSAAYSAQWKVGPLSEASIGNSGLGYYIRARDGVYTNETGMQDFFITPIGGLAWNVGEDAIDKYILTRVRRGTHNRVLLLLSAFTTPGKSAANVARFRAPYYRDLDASSAPTR